MLSFTNFSNMITENVAPVPVKNPVKLGDAVNNFLKRVSDPLQIKVKSCKNGDTIKIISQRNNTINATVYHYTPNKLNKKYFELTDSSVEKIKGLLTGQNGKPVRVFFESQRKVEPSGVVTTYLSFYKRIKPTLSVGNPTNNDVSSQPCYSDSMDIKEVEIGL